MHLPLRRVFDDKRRLVIPVLAGLALNVVLFAGVVYPLGARVRSMEARAASGRAGSCRPPSARTPTPAALHKGAIAPTPH